MLEQSSTYLLAQILVRFRITILYPEQPSFVRGFELQHINLSIGATLHFLELGISGEDYKVLKRASSLVVAIPHNLAKKTYIHNSSRLSVLPTEMHKLIA